MNTKDLSGLIIRNDHDELLILLERVYAKNQTIVNYDRHSDDCPNEKIDIGSWAHYGKKFDVIGKYVWVPAVEAPLDVFRLGLAKWKIRKLKEPIVLSICYDYLIGLGMDMEKIEEKVDGIFEDIRNFGLSINFVFGARSAEYCRKDYIEHIDNLLIERFKTLGIHLSPLTQRPLLGRP
jgi:hypothetical protein